MLCILYIQELPVKRLTHFFLYFYLQNMAPTKKRVAQLRRARAARFQPKVAEPVVEPTTTAAVSASRSKLSLFSSVDSVDLASVAAIIQLNAIQPLFEKFACPECSDGHFTLSCDSNKSAGLAVFYCGMQQMQLYHVKLSHIT